MKVRRSPWRSRFVAALALFAATAVEAKVSIVPRAELPFLTHGDPTGVSVAVLEDGSFAIAGTEVVPLDERHETAQFVVQFFDNHGRAQGKPVVVGERGTPAVGGIGSLGDRYFVTWASAYHPPSDLVTKASFYSKGGVRLAAPFPWPRSEIVHTNYHNSYRYGFGPAWRILPVVYHQVDVLANGEPLLQPTLQIFSSNASPLGPPFAVAPKGQDVDIEDAAINGKGRLALVSTRCPRGASSRSECIRGVQIFDEPRPFRSPLLTRGIEQPVTATGKDAGGFTIGLADQGSFLLTWGDDIDGHPRLLARLYDRSGAPLEDAFTLVSAEEGIPVPRSAIALANGNFLLSWLVHPEANNLFSAFFAEYGGNPPTLHAPTRYLDNEPLVAAYPIVGMNRSGQGVIVWKSQVGKDFVGYYSRFRFTSDDAAQTRGSENHEP